MIFRLIEETKEDIIMAGLGAPTLWKFLRVYFLYPEFFVTYQWKLARRIFPKSKLHRFIARLIMLRIFTTVSCQLSLHAKIGRRVHLVHPYGVGIGRDCQIGDDVKIYELVTIGRNDGDPVDIMPCIGNNVTIYIGARIQGGITIGDHAIIGANAVVTKDVPPYAVMAGVPARILRYVEKEPATQELPPSKEAAQA